MSPREFDITIKSLVYMFDRVHESILPEMIGGEFTVEEKLFLIDIARIQNKWIAGKKFLKEHYGSEIDNNHNEVDESHQAKITAEYGRQCFSLSVQYCINPMPQRRRRSRQDLRE